MSLRKNLGVPTKRDSAPAATRAKVTIRRNVLAAIGAKQAHVFDAFAGAGHMHREVWHEAAGYTGCDLRFYRDEREAFVADNRRVLRAIDLAPFNLFDLDAYGCPWEQVYIVARRRVLKPGEQIGIVITEGQGMKLKFGGMSAALAQMTRVDPRHMVGMSKGQDWLMSRAVGRIETLMRADIRRHWQATGQVGSRMVYMGLVLQGKLSSV